MPAYRSRIGPARCANSGSRGKIQERCCHALIASWDSHRHTVTPEICLSIPRVIASRASSEEDQREGGPPLRTRRRQPIPIPSARRGGGKSRRPPPPRQIFQAAQARLEEPLTPLRDDLTAPVAPCGDLVVT